MDCKEALAECDGDISKSIDFLRKKGLATASKRSGRVMSEGVIKSYIHTGSKLGVLVEIDCETDFVRPEDVPEEIINKEKEIYRAQALETGKPEKIVDKIAEGKLQKFYKDNCLMSQVYVRDPSVTIDDLLNGLIAKIGENITINRFVRFQVGES
jgi:elongation factor Ts